MAHAVHILGFSGSLRKVSSNSGLLRAATQLLPEGMSLEVFDLSPIPLYNSDLAGPGELVAVRAFKERIAASDGLLIVTPEYNYSVSGVLKNAIDWASRPPADSPLKGKPLAMMGAGGVMGTLRAQIHLRQILQFNGTLPLQKPEVYVSRAWEKFDPQGNLIDEDTKKQVRALLEALDAWILRLDPKDKQQPQ